MKPHPQRSGAFTTIELLVVIGIIVLLISLLIPVVGRVQQSAKAANTAALISQLSSAIESYHQDFKAYPGPLRNNEIHRGGFTGVNFIASPGFQNADGSNGPDKITMAENLVLGLLGGLRFNSSSSRIEYEPSLVGKGPQSLNPGRPKAYSPYLESVNLSWQTIGGNQTGAFFDEASIGGSSTNPIGADDSIIPEFVDRYSDPMPILYLRPKVGTVSTAFTPTDNPVITTNTDGEGNGAYDLNQIIGYTKPPIGGTPIGVSKKLPMYVTTGNVNSPPDPDNMAPHHGLRSVNPTAVLNKNDATGGGLAYLYPYDAFAYFRDPTLSGKQSAPRGPQVPRQKDRFILISAGGDRVYGTDDDITSFGAVVP